MSEGNLRHAMLHKIIDGEDMAKCGCHDTADLAKVTFSSPSSLPSLTSPSLPLSSYNGLHSAAKDFLYLGGGEGTKFKK